MNDMYSNYFIDDNDFLRHYGVKGMKWGVRRQIKKSSLRAAKYGYKADRLESRLAKRGGGSARAQARLSKLRSKQRQNQSGLSEADIAQGQRAYKRGRIAKRIGAGVLGAAALGGAAYGVKRAGGVKNAVDAATKWGKGAASDAYNWGKKATSDASKWATNAYGDAKEWVEQAASGRKKRRTGKSARGYGGANSAMSKRN